MNLKLLNDNGISNSYFKVSKIIFDKEYNKKLIHQIIVSYRSNSRIGSRKQKNRSDVKYSTKKPWKQKGTGKARAGMLSSPLWRGGGRAFPSIVFENFHHKINKKMYKLSICIIFSQLIRENRLFVIKNFNIKNHKTKYFLYKLKCINLNLNSILIITNKIMKNLYLASRNVPNILIIKTHQINPISLIYYKKILITQEALLKIQKWLLYDYQF